MNANSLCIVSLLIGSAAAAQNIQRYRIDRIEGGVANEVAGEGAWSPIRPGDKPLWDNFTNSPVHSEYRSGSHEVGEICNGLAGAGGVLNDITVAVHCFSTTASITRFRETWRFYTPGGALIGSKAVTITFSAPLPPGANTYISVGGGLSNFWTSPPLTLPENFTMTHTFSNVVGGDVNDLGLLTGGPVGSGSSPGYSVDLTTGQQINLAGGDHFEMYVFTRGCRADFNNDVVVDFFDYLDFVNAFAAAEPRSDFNEDGVIDFFDYLDFVDVFSAPC